MSLKEQLTEDMKSAMRSGNTTRRDTVRMALNAIAYAEKAKGKPLDDTEEVVALQQQAKQRFKTWIIDCELEMDRKKREPRKKNRR